MFLYELPPLFFLFFFLTSQVNSLYLAAYNNDTSRPMQLRSEKNNAHVSRSSSTLFKTLLGINHA